MEVIRIPQVSLVDATGRRIGVYTDDPDWWQQLKLKNSSENAAPAITNGDENARPDSGASSDAPAFGSTSKLIKFGDEAKNKATKEMQVATNNDQKKPVPYDDNQMECNMIGETPLHIAIMYDDLNTIKYLIDAKQFDVNQRSVGGKFTGGFNNKLTANLVQQSKYEGLAYYGEYPLAFAACFASKEIYDYLIEKGADPNLQDTNGNTVLHVLVINNKLDMFQYATNHPMRKAILTIKNNQDLTPINLAAKLGRKDLFEKMLELRTIEFWRYLNITCSAYPLEGLDTVDSDGKIAWNAALSYVVNGATDDHLDMLEIGVVKRLLEDKWSTYAQRRFFQKLIISAIHLIFLSIAVYTRAADSHKLAEWPVTTANTWVRYISEIAVVIGCLATLFQAAQEIYAQGFMYYLKNLSGEPANVFYNIFSIFILIALPFRFANFKNADGSITNRSVEDTLVILAIPCGWVHLLFYARVATVTGPFVVMIYKMIIGDILTFSSIYSLLLFGFSLGFYYLYKNAASSVKAMSNYPEALMLSFQMTLGEFKARLPEFDELYYSDFTKVVFVAFMILMHILLLNMLIAMMGNTYHQIIKKSEKEWRKQWAQVVILLERSFSPQDLKKFQNQYCIKLPSKDQDNKPELGLMVIKKVSKTKAFQKTNCIRNWKKFCKGVLDLLKSSSMNAIELLQFWEFKETYKYASKSKKNSNNLDSSWKGVSMNALKRYSVANINTNQRQPTNANKSNKNNIYNNNNNTNANKSKANNAVTVPPKKQPPPAPEPVKPKIAQDQNKNGPKSNVITNVQNNPKPLLKTVSESTTTTTTTTTTMTGTHSESGDNYDNHPLIQQTKIFTRTNTNNQAMLSYKKAFQPNQTTKLYPMFQNSDNNADNYELVNPKQVNIISPLSGAGSGSGSANSNNHRVVTNRNVNNIPSLYSDSKSDNSSLDGADLYGSNLFKHRKSDEDFK